MVVESPEDLYGLPLEEFIPKRAELVKALRGEKRREEAAQAAAARKPSVAAWAVNQLVRTQPKALRELFAAGDALAGAQARAEAGERAGDAMREATQRLREALGELARAAEGLLSSGGHALSPATLERVTDTLRAAAIDPEARRQVEDGCLTHELRFAGLGISAAGGGTATKPAAKPATRADTQREDAAVAEAKAQQDAERRRQEAVTTARRTQAEAKQAATRADKELQAAQARRDEAAASLQEADRALGDAQQRAERAHRELAAAEQALAKLG